MNLSISQWEDAARGLQSGMIRKQSTSLMYSLLFIKVNTYIYEIFITTNWLESEAITIIDRHDLI